MRSFVQKLGFLTLALAPLLAPLQIKAVEATAVTVKDGTLQPGTTTGIHLSSGTIVQFNAGTATVTGLLHTRLNCTSYANGGALTTTSTGTVVCSDDDAGSSSAPPLGVFLGGVQVSSPTSKIDLNGSVFTATESPTGTANVGLNASSVTLLGNSIDLSGEVTGNLPVTRLDSGTSANSSTFWRGDGSWQTPTGSAAGNTNNVQYNEGGGVMAGDDEFSFNPTTKELRAGRQLVIVSTPDAAFPYATEMEFQPRTHQMQSYGTFTNRSLETSEPESTPGFYFLDVSQDLNHWNYFGMGGDHGIMQVGDENGAAWFAYSGDDRDRVVFMSTAASVAPGNATENPSILRVISRNTDLRALFTLSTSNGLPIGAGGVLTDRLSIHHSSAGLYVPLYANQDIISSSNVNVMDGVYGAGWNGSTQVPTKNAIYDKIEALVLSTGTGGGSSIYPATATAHFPLGLTASTITATGAMTGTSLTLSGAFVGTTGKLSSLRAISTDNTRFDIGTSGIDVYTAGTLTSQFSIAGFNTTRNLSASKTASDLDDQTAITAETFTGSPTSYPYAAYMSKHFQGASSSNPYKAAFHGLRYKPGEDAKWFVAAATYTSCGVGCDYENPKEELLVVVTSTESARYGNVGVNRSTPTAKLDVNGSVKTEGMTIVVSTTMATISADTDNYNIPEFTEFVITTDWKGPFATNPPQLRGIANGTPGRVIRLTNIGSVGLYLVNQSTHSSAANRIQFSGTTGAMVLLDAYKSAELYYINSFWYWRRLD